MEQDVSPLLLVGIVTTLQSSLDLTDDGDKVIFRCGRKTIAHFVERTHGRADQFDLDCWQPPPNFTELCQNQDEGFATKNMSISAHVHQRLRCMDDDTNKRP